LPSYQERNIQSPNPIEALKLPSSKEMPCLALTRHQFSKIKLKTKLLLSLYRLFGVQAVILPFQYLSLEENLAKIILEATADFTAAFEGYDHYQEQRLVAQIQKITKSLDNYYKRKLLGDFVHY